MNNKKIRNKKISSGGQSVIEIVIALALFVIIASSLTFLALGSFDGLERGREFIQAGALAQEGVEAARSIRDRDWGAFSYNRSAVSVSGNRWIFTGEGTTEEIDIFTRTIDFSPVYRDGSGNIVAVGGPGAIVDASSTKVIVNITWEIRPGVDNMITRTTYLTNWR